LVQQEEEPDIKQGPFCTRGISFGGSLAFS
jgi:hypothetical protein